MTPAHNSPFDFLQAAAMNIASLIYGTNAVGLADLLPPPENVLQWSMGLAVGASLLTLNVLKIYVTLRPKRARLTKEETDVQE